MLTFAENGSDQQATSTTKVDSREFSVELVRGDQLTDPMLVCWNAICDSEPLLSSGYFRPGFYQAVCKVRSDVELAVIRQGEDIAGFWPFQRMPHGVAQPAGGMFNDFNGIIACGNPGQLNLTAVMKKCDLSFAAFHALIDQGLTSNRHVFARLESPFINLRDGVDNYKRWLRGNSLAIRKQPQKRRRMERDLGPVRLEFDVRDSTVLEKVIAWKRHKLRKTRTFDILSVDWAANLLREVFQRNDPGFRGMLNGMWAGDELVAAHFGFTSGDVLHYWIPAFNPAFAHYSPGTQLLLEIVDQCDAIEISQIDLSFGHSPLKVRFANDRQFVESCCVTASPVRAFTARKEYQLRQAIRKTPFKESIKRVLRPLFPQFGGKLFR